MSEETSGGMVKVGRVTVKFIGALLLLVLVLFICGQVAWWLLDEVKPQDSLIYFIGLSVISAILIGGLTIYRMMNGLRSTLVTIMFTSPMLVSALASIIYYWYIIEFVIIRHFPFMEDFFGFMRF